ncbi:hypothetical protein [Haloarcula laminariae]|uniref:hypothetical protein n=1 Tax=Haloarcula laminariae TaxID=2961577 RepID=UPI0021C7055B|nr:hypothetical protein [Halomicroarcula laminariae]
MECPRCGGTVTRYRLGEREAIGCQECAYVGVSVDHTAKRGPPESWDDAIDRFQDRGQTVTVVTRDDLSAAVPDGELPAEEELVNGVGSEERDDGDLVVPVFDAVDDGTADRRDDGESADETRRTESADAGD